ncbi:MAG: Arm DNA-binding domain-containing protein, partial [Desulfosalsimonas sp.]
MKITKKAIDAIKPPEKGKDYYFDEALPGFGVIVWPSGTKTFIFQYRINGQKKRITIGRHGKITVDNARKQAKIEAGKASGGIDPVAERHKKKAESLTLREALNDYLENRDLKPR